MTKEVLEEKKKMVFDFMSSKAYKPMKFKEMVQVLQVPAKQKKDLRRVLEALMDEGKITIDIKGKIKVLPSNVLTGTFMGTQKGFGFVRPEPTQDGENMEDIFIPGNRTKGAMDGDRVQILLHDAPAGRKQEGEVLHVLEHGTKTVVGTYAKSKNYGFVVSDNHKLGKDIYIDKENSKGAVTGHKVVVEILDYGDASHNPEGRVVEILGHVNDPGVDILSIVRSYGLPEEFPEGAMNQAEYVPDKVTEEDREGRTDCRDLQTVTIDGEDAKDLDDAISLTKSEDVYHLGVHIADVSHYVTEKSPLDVEAVKRGTSVYLVDRVIPMLPHKLSNGICSLNQGEDRLTLSCMMDIDKSGKVLSYRIEKTVINVDRRMSYNGVHAIVKEKDKALCKEYKEFLPMFQLMYELADILSLRRHKLGSIDFDFPESKITLDEKGKPLDVSVYERNSATHIIEEFMLIANQTVAEDMFWKEMPFVYRTHETPDNEKMEKLGIFVNAFGYSIKGTEDVHPKEIQKLLKKVAGKPEETLISRLALRSMKQAKYTVSCDGHFGLAMKYYCHFTSPIRRYPDLQIHRIIKETIDGRMTDKRISHYERILPEIAVQSSNMERRAEEAEREVEKMKKVEYMAQFLGCCFDGTISGMTTWGMYVELPNTVEGMIHVTSLQGDYYYFDEEHQLMVGEHTKKTYRLGEPVRIRVTGADKLLRTIDFEIVQEGEEEDG